MLVASRFRLTITAFIMGLLLVPVFTGTHAGAQTAPSTQVSDELVHTLCNKQVALLGENPVHGFGETLAFKVELVRRLVNECHYNAFFIEAGTYDFVNIQTTLNSGQQLTDPVISTAIGGLWADQEVQSLVPFLREKANRRELTLGGLDDQINRGTYAQTAMPADLVKSLPPGQQAECLTTLQQHMPWHYNPDSPDTPQDKSNIVGCLDRMEASLPLPPKRSSSENGTANMLDSLERNFSREAAHDLSKPDQQTPWMNERDHSMYLNFRWWLKQLPPHSKVIVWAATVHTAKGLSSAPGFETRIPLGSYIKRDLREKAFTLGFSAYSGSYWMVRPPSRQLAVAPATSLEGRSFAGRQADAIFVTQNELHAAGTIPARPLGINFISAPWDEVLDGLVIFREERSPTALNPR